MLESDPYLTTSLLTAQHPPPSQTIPYPKTEISYLLVKPIAGLLEQWFMEMIEEIVFCLFIQEIIFVSAVHIGIAKVFCLTQLLTGPTTLHSFQLNWIFSLLSLCSLSSFAFSSLYLSPLEIIFCFILVLFVSLH